ncbi:MAG TPA: type II/IV secretion system ATPase subunit [Thermoplasmata archaeon]|jgi:flagellar protein FlaI|nr:type II/IV secretion system ATPase subunit [Thermoplasmata archaeon]
MAASKEYQAQLDALNRQEQQASAQLAAAERSRAEAAQMLERIEEKKRNAVFAALDSFKKKYFHRLLGGRGVKVLAPRVSGVAETTLGKVTTIPKIVDPNLHEIEVQPILLNYSYVRVLYNTLINEYFYEVIEPKLLEEEDELLGVLKDILVDSLELLEDASAKERETYLRRIVDGLLRELGVTLHPVSKERIMYFVMRDFIRFSAIDVVMIDQNVEDVSCDGVGVPFYIYHRKYGSIPSNLKFTSEVELDQFVVWLAQKSGKHISVAQPMLDATIPDGSRLQATLGKHVTKRGSSFTIRRFKENPFTPLDLVRFKTMSPDMMAYLWLAIENGNSMLICGGTASGKTTTLNAILLFIPPQMKIVSIEDTRELNLPHENWVPLLTRGGFGGKSAHTGRAAGEIDMFDLLSAALRQRPQYLMVGEVRGPEAFVVFQAMATGKSAYTTFHADDVQSMVHRLENDPINLPRALVAALDLVLLQAQVKVGTDMTRRVKALIEIVGTDPESNELITNSAYTWNPADDTFNYSGHSYVYEKVMLARNWTQRRMEQEVKRRIDIFDYMRKIQIKNYREVAKIVSSYYKDPDDTMKMVREALAQQAGGQQPGSTGG